MKSKIVLILIIFLASFLRLYKLGEIPPSVISDEASIGYNAYSILKTGHPLAGNSNLPVYTYAAVPIVAVFGLNEFSTRLPSAIFGILSVIVIYYLAKELFKEETIAASAALFLAISPWSLHLSRMAVVGNLVVFFILSGCLLFLKSLKNERFLIPSLISFAVSFYITSSVWAFIPLFIFSLLILYRKKVLISLVFILVLASPLVNQMKIDAFSDIGIVYQINRERSFCWKTFPKFICSVAYNKPLKYLDAAIKNYLTHYSVRFLFLSGPENLKHYNVPGVGEYYLWQLPFLILGLFLLIRNKHAGGRLIFPWLLLFPVSISVVSPANPSFATSGIGIFELIISYGLFSAWNYFKKRRLIFLMILLPFALQNINEYFFLYYKKYSNEYSQTFQYGYKEAVNATLKEESKYSKVLFTKKYGDPYIFYLFYGKIDPKLAQQETSMTEKIGKINFVNFEEKDLKPLAGTLFVIGQKELKGGLTALKTINYLDGKPAFYIAE